MKVAVTSQGPGVESQVDPRFGRAAYFVVVDVESGQAADFSNEVNLNAVQGAGIQAARQVAHLGAKSVLTGQIGPKAFAALQAAGVTVYIGAGGTVRQAVECYRTGTLVEAAQATVDGHWM